MQKKLVLITGQLGAGSERVKLLDIRWTIIITEDDEPKKPQKVAIYARVSSSENKSNLDTQTERLKDYCAAKGLKVHKVVKEIGSGVNDNRQKLLKLLSDASITTIVVEHKDRLTRFGFNYIDKLFALQNRRMLNGKRKK